MPKNATLHIRVDESIKQNAEKTLDILGLSISDAVNMLLHQITLVGGLPFEVKVPSAHEAVTVYDKDDLVSKLLVGLEQIKKGQVIDSDVVMAELKKEYGV